MKKILLTTGILPPDIGGPAYYAIELKKAFEYDGHHITLHSYGWLKHLPTGIRHSAYGIKLLCSTLFSRPSFIIALDTFSVGFPSAIVGRLVGIPVIIRTGGDFLWEFYVERTKEKIVLSDFYLQPRNFTLKEKLIFKYTQRAFHYASHVVFSTTYQRDIFLSAYEFDKEKTTIIENHYNPHETSEGHTKKNFICFTRPLVWKNIETLKLAFEKTKGSSPDISLETGMLSRSEYLEKLKKCYAVVLVSLGDISPNMILEAIAYGKPFILTTENGIENRITGIGLRVHPQDEKALHDAIIHLQDPVVYAKEKEKIMQFSFSHSYDEIAEEFLDIAKTL
ncbi:MAG: hypothetical protein COU27_01730 [Candidatus Levybacteria bacterium CG10_big_fil_rev_8_21_14_0_10_36_7]|nr:MAG: hypothetical protein COU27_01730 [Candidatus Levybacteria bacterium CG10_big_fil_rev_8_21_14_0_10_36_7]